jgi:hypothetical protein
VLGTIYAVQGAIQLKEEKLYDILKAPNGN